MPKVKGSHDLAHAGHRRRAVQLGSKIRKRLAAYVASAAHRAPDILTAAAVGATALAGQPVEAGIIINNTPITIPAPTSFSSGFGEITVPWSFEGGNQFNFSNRQWVDVFGIASSLRLRAATGNGFLRGPLAKGAEIGPGGVFTGASSMAYVRRTSFGFMVYRGLWVNESGYLGFEFTDSTGLHFGWAYLSLDPHATTGVLSEFAYDTIPGQAIEAGQTSTPEPGTLGLLALGALGLGLWRRKALPTTQ